MPQPTHNGEGGGIDGDLRTHLRNRNFQQNHIRKRFRYPHASISYNKCICCERIISCPYEILRGYQWLPLCLDCKLSGGVCPKGGAV